MNEEINQVVKLDYTPTNIVFKNYDELIAKAKEHLEKYKNVIISEEDNKVGKELFVTINADYKAIDKFRKEFVKAASAPIKEVDEKIKELLSLYDEIKEALRKQTDAHDAKRKDIAAGLLHSLLNETWAALNVQDEFQKAIIDDLILLGSLTEKDNLKANVKREVESRAQADKNLQNQVEFRLKDLEAQSYKAGLAVPLSKSHVMYFLFEDENTYQEKLHELIGFEVARQAEADAIRKKQEEARITEIERQRVAAEQKAEQDRIAAELRAKQAEEMAEQARIKAEQDRIAAEQKAEQDRIAAEQKAEQDRLKAIEAANRIAEQKHLAELNAIEARHRAEMALHAYPDSAYDEENDYPADEESYKIIDKGLTVGSGDAGAQVVVKLSFAAPSHATKQDITQDIMKLLNSAGLGAYVSDIKTELLPF